MHDTHPVYDTVHNTLPEGEIYFHTHQQLWKDDISLGKIYISDECARLTLGVNEAITIPRNEFQRLFMTDAPIVQMIFSAEEVSSVRMIFYKNHHYFRSNKNRISRLYKHSDDNEKQFYADIYYTLKR